MPNEMLVQTAPLRTPDPNVSQSPAQPGADASMPANPMASVNLGSPAMGADSVAMAALKARLTATTRAWFPQLMEYQQFGVNTVFARAADIDGLQARLRELQGPALASRLQQMLEPVRMPVEEFLDEFRLWRSKHATAALPRDPDDFRAVVRQAAEHGLSGERAPINEMLRQANRLAGHVAATLDVVQALKDSADYSVAWSTVQYLTRQQQIEALLPVDADNHLGNYGVSMARANLTGTRPENIKLDLIVKSATWAERQKREALGKQLSGPTGKILMGIKLTSSYAEQVSKTPDNASLAGLMVYVCNKLRELINAINAQWEEVQTAPDQPVEAARLPSLNALEHVKNIPAYLGFATSKVTRPAKKKALGAKAIFSLVSKKFVKNMHRGIHPSLTLMEPAAIEAKRKTDQVLFSVAIDLLNEIQQKQAAIAKLHGAVAPLQQAIELSQELLAGARLGSHLTLDAELAKEADRWQVTATTERKAVEERLKSLTTLARGSGQQDYLDQMENRLDQAPADARSQATVAAFQQRVTAVVNALARLEEALARDTLRLSDHGRQGGRDLDNLFERWSQELLQLKADVKTGFTQATERSINNFSRNGMLARGIAQLSEVEKQAWLAELSPDARKEAKSQYEALFFEVMEDFLPLLSKDHDPQSHNLLKRLRSELQHEALGTTQYPATMAELLAGMKSRDKTIKDWSRRKLVSTAFLAAFLPINAGVKLATLPMRAAVKLSITGGQVALAARKAQQGIRLGEGHVNDEVWMFAGRRFETAAIKMVLALPAGLAELVGIATVVIDIAELGRAGAAKKIVGELLNEAPWGGLRVGTDVGDAKITARLDIETQQFEAVIETLLQEAEGDPAGLSLDAAEEAMESDQTPTPVQANTDGLGVKSRSRRSANNVPQGFKKVGQINNSDRNVPAGKHVELSFTVGNQGSEHIIIEIPEEYRSVHDWQFYVAHYLNTMGPFALPQSPETRISIQAGEAKEGRVAPAWSSFRNEIYASSDTPVTAFSWKFVDAPGRRNAPPIYRPFAYTPTRVEGTSLKFPVLDRYQQEVARLDAQSAKLSALRVDLARVQAQLDSASGSSWYESPATKQNKQQKTFYLGEINKTRDVITASTRQIRLDKNQAQIEKKLVDHMAKKPQPTNTSPPAAVIQDGIYAEQLQALRAYKTLLESNGVQNGDFDAYHSREADLEALEKKIIAAKEGDGKRLAAGTHWVSDHQLVFPMKGARDLYEDEQILVSVTEGENILEYVHIGVPVEHRAGTQWPSYVADQIKLHMQFAHVGTAYDTEVATQAHYGADNYLWAANARSVEWQIIRDPDFAQVPVVTNPQWQNPTVADGQTSLALPRASRSGETLWVWVETKSTGKVIESVKVPKEEHQGPAEVAAAINAGSRHLQAGKKVEGQIVPASAAADNQLWVDNPDYIVRYASVPSEVIDERLPVQQRLHLLRQLDAHPGKTIAFFAQGKRHPYTALSPIEIDRLLKLSAVDRAERIRSTLQTSADLDIDDPEGLGERWMAAEEEFIDEIVEFRQTQTTSASPAEDQSLAKARTEALRYFLNKHPDLAEDTGLRFGSYSNADRLYVAQDQHDLNKAWPAIYGKMTTEQKADFIFATALNWKLANDSSYAASLDALADEGSLEMMSLREDVISEFEAAQTQYLLGDPDPSHPDYKLGNFDANKSQFKSREAAGTDEAYFKQFNDYLENNLISEKKNVSRKLMNAAGVVNFDRTRPPKRSVRITVKVPVVVQVDSQMVPRNMPLIGDVQVFETNSGRFFIHSTVGGRPFLQEIGDHFSSPELNSLLGGTVTAATANKLKALFAHDKVARHEVATEGGYGSIKDNLTAAEYSFSATAVTSSANFEQRLHAAHAANLSRLVHESREQGYKQNFAERFRDATVPFWKRYSRSAKDPFYVHSDEDAFSDAMNAFSLASLVQAGAVGVGRGLAAGKAAAGAFRQSGAAGRSTLTSLLAAARASAPGLGKAARGLALEVAGEVFPPVDLARAMRRLGKVFIKESRAGRAKIISSRASAGDRANPMRSMPEHSGNERASRTTDVISPASHSGELAPASSTAGGTTALRRQNQALDANWQVDVSLQDVPRGTTGRWEGIYAKPGPVQNRPDFYIFQDEKAYRVTWDKDGPYWRVRGGEGAGDFGPSSALEREGGRWRRRIGRGGQGGQREANESGARQELKEQVRQGRRRAKDMLDKAKTAAKDNPELAKPLGQALGGWPKVGRVQIDSSWEAFHDKDLPALRKKVSDIKPGESKYVDDPDGIGAVVKRTSAKKVEVSPAAMDDLMRRGDSTVANANLSRSLMAAANDSGPGQVPNGVRELSDGSLDVTELALQSMGRPKRDGGSPIESASVMAQILAAHQDNPQLLTQFLLRYKIWKKDFEHLEYTQKGWHGRRAILKRNNPDLDDAQLDAMADAAAMKALRDVAEASQRRLIYGGKGEPWQRTQAAIRQAEAAGADFPRPGRASAGHPRDAVFDLQLEGGIISPAARHKLEGLPERPTLQQMFESPTKPLRSLADLENMTPGYAVCLVDDQGIVAHTLINKGEGHLAGMQTGELGGSHAGFASIDLRGAAISPEGSWRIKGKSYKLHAEPKTPEYRIEPIRPVDPQVAEVDLAEINRVLAPWEKKQSDENNRLGVLRTLAGNCEAVMVELKGYLQEKGFTDFQYRGMHIYTKNQADPGNHFVLLARPPGGGELYAFDLTSAQFPGLSSRMVMSENNWRYTFGRQMAETNKVVKYRDFNSGGAAVSRYSSNGERPPQTYDEGEYVLELSDWYMDTKRPATTVKRSGG